MKVSIHSLYWDNGSVLAESQKQVMDHFGVNINQYHLNGVGHGAWMNSIMDNAKEDVIGFIDNDCVITNKDIVSVACNYAFDKESFIGVAQASNHIKPCSHIFAAPAFLFISKECYLKMGSPKFSENYRSDVAEEFSYIAEDRGIKYRALYPTHYERESTDGLWALSNYGYYAIGTHFQGGVYHLYQGRYNINIELFKQRCSEIINGTFSLNGMRNCLELI